MEKRLSRKNAVFTPRSGTTRLINYENARHVLEVQFTSDEIYHYFNVPSSIWKEYKSVVFGGESSGTFLNTRIKPFYHYVKLTDEK